MYIEVPIPVEHYEIMKTNGGCESSWCLHDGRSVNGIYNFHMYGLDIVVTPSHTAGNAVSRDELAGMFDQLVELKRSEVMQQNQVAYQVGIILPDDTKEVHTTCDEEYIYKLVKYKGEDNERSKIYERERYRSKRIEERKSRQSQNAPQVSTGKAG